MIKVIIDPDEVRVLVNQGKSDAEIGRYFLRSDKWCFDFRKGHGIKSKYSRIARHLRKPAAPKLTLEQAQALSEVNRDKQHGYSCIGMKSGAEELMAEFFRDRRYEDVKLKERTI